jgi:hypothetical protein
MATVPEDAGVPNPDQFEAWVIGSIQGIESVQIYITAQPANAQKTPEANEAQIILYRDGMYEAVEMFGWHTFPTFRPPTNLRVNVTFTVNDTSRDMGLNLNLILDSL